MPTLSRIAKASKKAADRAEKAKAKQAKQKKEPPRDIRKGGVNYGKVGAAATAAAGIGYAATRDDKSLAKAKTAQKERVNRTEKELKKLGY